MKIIKLRFLTSYNVLITAVLALLGFATACERFPRMEYGTPHATFIAKGNITSAESNIPIPGIQVRMVADSNRIQVDSINSGSDGMYSVDGFGSPMSQSFTLHFRDVDGTTNGEFQNLDTVVEFKDPIFIDGDGHWYQGETEQELNIKLNPKK
jgi:putative lipoprotein (rSAM/lipoprotein system)